MNVTIELCAEDRARLDRIIGLLTESIAPSTAPAAKEEPKKVTNAADAVKAMENFAKGAAEPTQETIAFDAPTTEPLKEEKPTEPKKAPPVSVQEVQALVIKLCQISDAKKTAAREVVNAYAMKVSDIPADKLPEAYKRLKALEG